MITKYHLILFPLIEQNKNKIRKNLIIRFMTTIWYEVKVRYSNLYLLGN